MPPAAFVFSIAGLSVNRGLSRFASLGYISLDRGRITLLRPEDLRRRGE